MKKVFAALMILLCAAYFPACAGSEETADATPAPTETLPEKMFEGAELSVWLCTGEEQGSETLENQFADIADKYSLTLSLEKLEPRQFRDRLDSGQEPADIMYLSYQQAADAYSRRLLMPLDGEGNSIHGADFSLGAIAALTGADGQLYGLPDCVRLTAVYYRSDIFRDKKLLPPDNWADFSALAETLNDGDTLSGFSVAPGDERAGLNLLYSFMARRGIGISDEDSGEYIFERREAEVTTVIEDIARLYAAASPSGALAWNEADSAKALAEDGSLAMALNDGTVAEQAGEYTDKLRCFFLKGTEDGFVSGSGNCFIATWNDSDEKRALELFVLAELNHPDMAAQRSAARPGIAPPSMLSAHEQYEAELAKQGLADMARPVLEAVKGGNWHSPGQENWLSPLAAGLYSTELFSRAIQGACDGAYSPQEAFRLINEQLRELSGSV